MDLPPKAAQQSYRAVFRFEPTLVPIASSKMQQLDSSNQMQDEMNLYNISQHGFYFPCFGFHSVSIKNSIYLYISYSQAATLVLILLQVISAQTYLSDVASILIGLFMLATAPWEFSGTIVYTA